VVRDSQLGFALQRVRQLLVNQHLESSFLGVLERSQPKVVKVPSHRWLLLRRSHLFLESRRLFSTLKGFDKELRLEGRSRGLLSFATSTELVFVENRMHLGLSLEGGFAPFV